MLNYINTFVIRNLYYSQKMKKTFDRVFRRKSIAEAGLREDYPTYSDSDVTDDERRQQEWQNQLNRRETIADGATGDIEPDEQWEYESEYNVEFPSESSIIDAYKEKRKPRTFYEDREFEDLYHTIADNDRFDIEKVRNERKDKVFVVTNLFG